MKVETTNEKVLEASKKCPQAKAVLQALFPEVFEDQTIFCEIGSIFFRSDYPNNIYAVIKNGNQIVVMNITHSTKWNYDEKRSLLISELTDRMQENITVTEFKKLSGYTRISNFLVVPKVFNNKISAFTKEAKASYNK